MDADNNPTTGCEMAIDETTWQGDSYLFVNLSTVK